MAAEPSRRRFLSWTVAGIGGLAAGSCSAKSAHPVAGASTTAGAGARDTVRIGVVAPFSGLGAFVGTIAKNSLDATVAHVNATGGVGGRKLEVVSRDASINPEDGIRAYQEFAADPGVIGVLWCGGQGLEESRAQIGRDGVPVLACFDDQWSGHHLYPEVPERSIFQLLVPDRMAMDLLVGYAKDDRGYRRLALLYDSLLGGETKGWFRAAMTDHQLAPVAIESFTVLGSEYGPQLQRLKAARPEALVLWGLPANTGAIARDLDALGAGYVDAPAAKAGGAGTGPWRPQVLGSPEGCGDHTWADLAGGAAKVGTVTAWHVGGLTYLPDFAIRDWMRQFLHRTPTGGEELPADGVGTLLAALRRAGTADRARMVSTIESMGRIRFASIDFGFSASSHLARSPDDLILVTLERATGAAPTTPAYALGREWREFFPAGYAGPTHLVRPTLAANRRAHPDVMDEVLRLGYGTQCTRHADGTLGAECKVH